MKNSLIIVLVFIIGILFGRSESSLISFVNNEFTAWVLYLLMLQVGISIGSDKNIKTIIKSIRPKLLLIPLATIIGSLSFAALIGMLLPQFSFFEYMAAGSGFAYYSLSSILIAQLKSPSIGVQLATELSTIALMANIFREMAALVLAPFLEKYFGKLAPICAAGATTMDTTLPIITQVCGKDWVFISILHGIIVDFTVPIFVSFFCSL